jgi:Ricin-type beta-trefoil lectin domain-like
MTQWFYIFTGTNVDGHELLNVVVPEDLGTNDSGLNDATVNMWYANTEWTPYSIPVLNQMWQLTIDGYIVSALNPNYVLGTGSTGACLVQRSAGDTSQQWQFQWVLDGGGVMMGTLCNKASQQYLVTVAAPASNSPVTTQGMPDVGATPPMMWFIKPSSPPTGQLLSIQSAATGTASPMVVNIQNGSLEPGATTILWPAEPNSPNAIWKYTPEGFLLGTLNSELALSLNVNSNQGDAGKNGVATYPKQPVNTSFQQWSFNLVDVKAGTYLIVNQQNGQALGLTDTGNGAALRTAPPDATNERQLWRISPTYGLEVVLAQPATGYAAFTGDEASAYSYLNQALGLAELGTELRSQYTNLAAPLAAYQSRVNMIMTSVILQHSSKDKNPPAALPAIDAMVKMAAQLSEELTAAQAVQQLFQQLTMFHTELATVATNATAEVIADAEIDTQLPHQQARVSVASIFEGLIYTILSAGSLVTGEGEIMKGVGLILPVVANLFQTGVNGASSYMQSQAQNAEKQKDETIFYNFEGEISEIQQFLVDSFDAIGNALAVAESLILGDSFKTRTVAAMAAIPHGGDSLFWPPEQGPMLITRLLPGYEIGVLQALLPTKYQLFTGTWIDAPSQSTYDNIPPGDVPSYCVRYETTNKECNGYMTQWIAGRGTKDGLSGYPGKSTMNLLWNNGVRPFNFFCRQGGWENFLTTECWLTKDYNAIVLFHNYTNVNLEIALEVTDTDHFLFGYAGPSSITLSLPPYGDQFVVLMCQSPSHKNPTTKVTVTTPGGTQVWSTPSAGAESCSAVTCSNGFATYPYNSTNAPVLFGTTATGCGGVKIGIAMARG